MHAWSRHPSARRASLVAGLAFALVAATPPGSASAFTTRVHIVLANEVRAALIESGDGTIELRWSEHAVRIPREDADAIINQPLAFRAGAIGPDNVVFPAMTDGSHGVEQDPYRQCELLYVEALTEAERAYALGCFLHGATDAVAHHLVNYFTGETFTLNPISASRLPSYDNVIGHMVTESAIQRSLHREDASAFAAGQLQHSIPQDFVLRTYFHSDSPVWQRLTRDAVERWESARAADPGGDLRSWGASAGFAPWEHIAMSPVYIAELQRLRGSLRGWIEGEIADLADPRSSRGAQLGVRAGPDGRIGTPDDTTECTGTCPVLAAQYYVYVNILAPRYDAGGRELPSAFDVLSSGLGDQLYGFLPALVRVIDNLSARLNTPIPAGDASGHDFDVSPADIAATFAPLTDWLDGLVRTTDAGFDGLADSITPDWYRTLSSYLRRIGVDVSIGNVLRLVFGPIIDQIRDALVAEVRGRAEAYLLELSQEYRARGGSWSREVEALLGASAPPGLGGHALDHPHDAGWFVYAFNITAASFANHELVLAPSDPIGSGPASFDASYTLEWTQAGVCEYLREAIFPRGTGLAPLLSVQQGPMYFGSGIAEDSPVECHAGALASFGAPSATSCAHTSLEALLFDRTGSLSRAFPPEHAAGEPGCRRLVVPGLPAPPPLPDGGMQGPDGGTGVPDGGGGGPTEPMGPTDGGCGCSAVGASAPTPWPLAVGLLGLLLLVRRRAARRAAPRRRAPLALGALALGALTLGTACDGPVATMDAGVRDAATDAAETDGAILVEVDARPMDLDGGVDAGRVDAGPDLRRALLDALAGSVWSAVLPRDEGGTLASRAYEMRFDTRDLRWAEIRNPFGPGRQRVLRSFNPRPDGRTVESTVMIPTGWETPEPLRGRRETWEIEIVTGSPRFLHLRNMTTGVTEELAEGAWPEPSDGLTAEVRVFGSSTAAGSVDRAYCSCGTGCTYNRAVLWDFARGRSSEAPLGYDVVAGIRPTRWVDTTANLFAVTDVAGFERLGGTTLSAQRNFIVRYHGRIRHSGGSLSFREANNSVGTSSGGGGLWAWIGPGVGTTARTSLWFETHWYPFTSDWTDDEVSATFPAGDVEIEVMMVRCATALSGDSDIDPQMRFGTAAWVSTGSTDVFLPSLPAELFPSAL